MDNRITFYKHKESEHVYAVFTSVPPRQIQILNTQHLAWPALSLERTYPWAMTPCRWFADTDLPFYQQISHDEAATLYSDDIAWLDQVMISFGIGPDGDKISYADVMVGPKFAQLIMAKLIEQHIPFRTWCLPADTTIIMVEESLAEQLNAIAEPISQRLFERIGVPRVEIQLDGIGTVSVRAKTADEALALVDGHVFLTTDDPLITVENAGEWNFEVAEEEEND